MRLFLLFLALAFLLTTALAWTKEDHEIFDLVSALEAAEGKDTSFYSFLGVPTSATSQEISRAYKRKSVQLHPDKNPGKKNAQERFARLGVIAQILRNKEARERYDFFLKNGVPRWRGTGYYYSRYRPGLGFVAVFLVILTTALQYLIQRINYKNDLSRIDRFVTEARQAAWGPKLTPLEGRRKVRVNVGGRAYMDEEGNVIPGKQVDMVVDGNEVYIMEPDGSLLPLDEGAASPPAWKRTWFIALVLKYFGKKTETASIPIESDEAATDSNTESQSKKQRKAARKALRSRGGDNGEEQSSSEVSSGISTPVNEAANSKPVPRGPTMMAGGRRRKAVPRKRPERKNAEAEGSADASIHDT